MEWDSCRNPLRADAITIKFGASLLLVLQVWGKAPIGPFVLCQPIGVFPHIWGKWQNDVPVRLFSSFLQKSQSSCHCFDRHQLGFTNSILLNGIFDICSRIYSLQIDLQCYLQSVPSVGINLNHDLEEGSYWSINFVLTNRSVSPNLMVNSCLKFKIRFRKCPHQPLKIEQNATTTHSDVSWHMWEG